MKYCIDRFEGDFSILVSDEDKTVCVEKARLPECVREGDLLESDDLISFAFLKGATEKRRESIRSKFEKIIKKDGI